MKKIILLCTFLIVSLAGSAQLISDYAEVVKRANSEIDASLASGYLHKMAEKYNVAPGEYTFTVSIHDKGKVLSVFVSGNNMSDIKQQNLVKDIIRQMDFDFKMPKGNIYKFERTFKF